MSLLEASREGADLEAGAENLLLGCLQVRAGERLLLIHEAEDGGYYHPMVPRAILSTARRLGLRVEAIEAGPGAMDDATQAALATPDHVVFTSRLGDQLRFTGTTTRQPPAMVYALDETALAGPFARAPHPVMLAIKSLINRAIAAAEEIRLSCPLGTDVVGRLDVDAVTFDEAAAGEVAVRRFPMSIFKPVPCTGFRGRVALARFLIGTGAQEYEPYALPLSQTVFAEIEGRRIVSVEGPPTVVAAVRAHYCHVAGLFGLDPWVADSWHAGLHPGCAFVEDPWTAPKRWGGSAFGNPRVLHFHTCGDAPPGEISWTILDPTITLDGVPAWRGGRVQPAAIPGMDALLARHPEVATLYTRPPAPIGL